MERNVAAYNVSPERALLMLVWAILLQGIWVSCPAVLLIFI